jgi:hypothetical protein
MSQSKIEFSLHKDLAAWIDRESDRIAALVQDVTEIALRSGGMAPHPDLPINATIGPKDIIGEVIASSSDANGNMVARFYQHQGRILGLINGAMVDAQIVVERIWSRRELCDLVSRITLLDLFLEYVGEKARGMPTAPLSAKIVDLVIKKVRRLSVWVPIDEVFVEGEFSFATAVLAPVPRARNYPPPVIGA